MKTNFILFWPLCIVEEPWNVSLTFSTGVKSEIPWMTVNQRLLETFYILWKSHKSSPQTCLDDIKATAHLSKEGPKTSEPCNDVLSAHISFDYEHCSFNSLRWVRKHQQMCVFQNRFSTKSFVVYCSLANLMFVLDWNFKCNFK